MSVITSAFRAETSRKVHDLVRMSLSVQGVVDGMGRDIGGIYIWRTRNLPFFASDLFLPFFLAILIYSKKTPNSWASDHQRLLGKEP